MYSICCGNYIGNLLRVYVHPGGTHNSVGGDDTARPGRQGIEMDFFRAKVLYLAVWFK
jgi:hypothetical protein